MGFAFLAVSAERHVARGLEEPAPCEVLLMSLERPAPDTGELSATPVTTKPKGTTLTSRVLTARLDPKQIPKCPDAPLGFAGSAVFFLAVISCLLAQWTKKPLASPVRFSDSSTEFFCLTSADLIRFL